MLGSNVVSALSLASGKINFIARATSPTRRLCIALVRVSKGPIGFGVVTVPPSQKPGNALSPHATVTRTAQHTENIAEISTKNEHARVIAGPIEKYSAWSLRAAGLPLDAATAAYQRELNNADRIRRETAWGRKQTVEQRASDAALSDWQPCLPSDHATLPDLTIPDFLRRP